MGLLSLMACGLWQLITLQSALGCLRGMCFLLKINVGSGDPIPSRGGFNPTALWGQDALWAPPSGARAAEPPGLQLGSGASSPGCKGYTGDVVLPPNWQGMGGCGDVPELACSTWAGEVLLLRGAQRLQFFRCRSCMPHQGTSGSEKSHYFHGWAAQCPKPC